LALIVNIQRWVVILQQERRKLFKLKIYLVIINAVVLSAIWFIESPHINWAILMGQGTINIALTVSYKRVLN
jgi:hypothetical protein